MFSAAHAVGYRSGSRRALPRPPRSDPWEREMQDIIVRYVYELIDPFTKKTRYVGCAKDPHGRLRGHVHESALV
jgi:hypothetical protein